MQNILEKTNDAIYRKEFTDGLSKYTQQNCQVTLTDDGYRIYRPANLNPTDDGRTMWGGLVIKPFEADPNALQDNHRYVLKFDIKGQTGNYIDNYGWRNNVGWEGGGLNPTPGDVVTTEIGAGWTSWTSENWFPYSYAWTINDGLYKVCTESYATFVKGETYLSYRDFIFGYSYQGTGALGTDIYIRNIRLYDITNKTKEIKVKKTGIVNAGNFVEYKGNFSTKNDGDIYNAGMYEI